MSLAMVFLSLPIWFLYPFIFFLGAIIGSFLDVIVTRFHTNASLNGRSRCLSCGKTLSWYELVPFLSYLLLRGRCFGCNSKIPKRLLHAEIITGTLFLLSYLAFGPDWLTLFSFVLVSVLVVVTFYDIEHMIIPNELVAVTGLVILLTWVYEVSGTFVLHDLYSALLASAASFAFYAALWFYSKGRWIGFGDAKLAIPLGFILGPMGALSFIIFSFWIGAAVSVVLLLAQRLLNRGQKHLPFLGAPIKMSSEVPFAPFMVASFLLVYLFKADVLILMSNLLYGSV